MEPQKARAAVLEVKTASEDGDLMSFTYAGGTLIPVAEKHESILSVGVETFNCLLL